MNFFACKMLKWFQFFWDRWQQKMGRQWCEERDGLVWYCDIIYSVFLWGHKIVIVYVIVGNKLFKWDLSKMFSNYPFNTTVIFRMELYLFIYYDIVICLLFNHKDLFFQFKPKFIRLMSRISWVKYIWVDDLVVERDTYLLK